jgi:peptide/nickel transport system ATP-binding protein
MSVAQTDTRSGLAAAGATALLRVDDLRVYFATKKSRIWARAAEPIKAVDGVSFDVRDEETFSLVGESGCGKTTTCRAVLKVRPPTGGAIRWRGKDLQTLNRQDTRAYRSSVQAVFQDPFSAMNPRLRIGDFIAEALLLNLSMDQRQRRERAREALCQVGMRAEDISSFPHEFSGGQRQRIAIARAIASMPRLIVLDEPVSSLDVSIRAQIMNLLKDLQEREGYSYLFIAHHLGTVRYMSHVVGVMYLGRMMELAPSEELFSNPLHPYTQALLSAALPDHPDVKREQVMLKSEIEPTGSGPAGCRLHARCPFAKPVCRDVEPAWKRAGPDHWTACHLH